MAAALLGVLTLATASCDFTGSSQRSLATLPANAAGFTNYHLPEGPWSVHVVRWPRTLGSLRLLAAHADDHALGLAVLTDVLKRLPAALGQPVAALNGDFFQRDRAFAGDPRGLQITDGELVSGPDEKSTAFWLDDSSQPHLDTVRPRFEVTWPDGSRSPIGWNEEPRPTNAVLLTPRLGELPAASGGTNPVGRRLVLEAAGKGPWLPLRIGETRSARLREVQANTPSAPPSDTNTVVLVLGPALHPPPPELAPGAVLQLSTATAPDLRGASVAIAGGPALVRGGRVQKNGDADADDYATSTMLERHPRSAFGWNREFFFLVQVDGRQKDVSVGMTLDELARELVRLGCDEALNFDGGGSSALWFDGRIRNRPCDGFERSIANALVLLETTRP